MRKPEYLSPSSLSCWLKDPTEYYRRYLSDIKPDKFPQDRAMASGSAFDAYVKSHLHDVIYGKNHKDSNKYQLKEIFEAQVEPQNRDWAWPVGAYLFACYKESGALADLLMDLSQASDDPRFEIEVKGVITGPLESDTGHGLGEMTPESNKTREGIKV